MLTKLLILPTVFVVLLSSGCATTTKLTSAVTANNMVAVQSAIKSGSKIDELDGNGQTALTLAVSNGNTKVVKYLLKHNANPNIREMPEPYAELKRGYPILLAAKDGNTEIIELLLEAGADVNQKSFDRTPLVSAVKGGHIRVVKLLVDRGAKVNLTGEYHRSDSAIQVAAIYAKFRPEIFKYLIEANSESSTLNFPSIVRSGDMKLIKRLIAEGADVNGNESSGYPIIEASLGSDPEVITLLIAAGANPNQVNYVGMGALSFARDLDVIKTLIALGADVNAGTNPPLSIHIGGNIEIVKYLLSAGANPKHEAYIFKVLSPGRRCAKEGVSDSERERFEYLMASGADIDQAGDYERTALHQAAACQDFETVKLLVDSGASMDVRDFQGKTPYDLTRPILKGCQKPCRYIESHSGGSGNENSFGKIFATAAIAGLASNANISAADSAKVMKATVNDIWVKDGKGTQLASMANAKREQQSAAETHKKEMKKYQDEIKQQREKREQKPSLYQQQLNRIAGQSNGSKVKGSSSANMAASNAKPRPSKSIASNSNRRNSIRSNNQTASNESSGCSGTPPTSSTHAIPILSGEGKGLKASGKMIAQVNEHMENKCGANNYRVNGSSIPRWNNEILRKAKFNINNLERATIKSGQTFSCGCNFTGEKIKSAAGKGVSR